MIPSLNLIASTLVPVTIGCLDTLSTYLPHRSRRRTACAARPRRRRRAARAARAAGTSRTRRTPRRAALARVGVSAAGGGRAHRAAPVRREVVHRGGRRAGAQGDAQAASVAARPVTCAVSSASHPGPKDVHLLTCAPSVLCSSLSTSHCVSPRSGHSAWQRRVRMRSGDGTSAIGESRPADNGP
jgi:hypothetical protein